MGRVHFFPRPLPPPPPSRRNARRVINVSLRALSEQYRLILRSRATHWRRTGLRDTLFSFLAKLSNSRCLMPSAGSYLRHNISRSRRLGTSFERDFNRVASKLRVNYPPTRRKIKSDPLIDLPPLGNGRNIIGATTKRTASIELTGSKMSRRRKKEGSVRRSFSSAAVLLHGRNVIEVVTAEQGSGTRTM